MLLVSLRVRSPRRDTTFTNTDDYNSGDCVTGYFPVTQARGQISGISSSTVCDEGDFQNLCCAPGTTTGTCAWEGWGGAGMACGTPACNNSDAIAVAGNSKKTTATTSGENC